jgi:tetratricopeptide (TPR) repeat protein
MSTRVLGCVLLALAALPTGCASAAAQARREQQALKKDTSADELFRKGQASAQVGDMTRAEQYFVAALKAGGKEREIVPRLLVVCVADQRYPVALEYANVYLAHYPNDYDVQLAAASIHAAQGDLARARELLEGIVRQRPAWAEPHYVLASVLREQGEAPDLVDLHEIEYLRLNPHGQLADRVRARLRRAMP